MDVDAWQKASYYLPSTRFYVRPSIHTAVTAARQVRLPSYLFSKWICRFLMALVKQRLSAIEPPPPPLL